MNVTDSYKAGEIVKLKLNYYEDIGESSNIIPRSGWRVIDVEQSEITIRYDKDGRLFVMVVNEKYLSAAFI